MVGMVWDRLASSYDIVATAYEEEFLDELDAKPQDQQLLRVFADATSHSIADVGCGPGQVGRFLCDKGRTVVGVDISMEMARLAAKRLDAAFVADVRMLPFGGTTLGGVVAFYSLIHLPREELHVALAEIRRVLRPGGRVLLAVHEGRGQIEQHEFLGEEVPFAATLFSLDELAQAIHRSGLRLTMSTRRAPYETEHQTVRLYVEAECHLPVTWDQVATGFASDIGPHRLPVMGPP
jgi:SAM-dependent methyltransferase